MVKHSLHVFISDCNCLKSFKIFISRPHTRFLLASYNKKPTNKIHKKWQRSFAEAENVTMNSFENLIYNFGRKKS